MKFLSLALALSLLTCGSEGDESSSIPANNGSLA